MEETAFWRDTKQAVLILDRPRYGGLGRQVHRAASARCDTINRKLRGRLGPGKLAAWMPTGTLQKKPESEAWRLEG